MSGKAADLLRSTHLSYSKLHTYKQCPLRFKLEYLDGCEVDGSSSLELGSVVHSVIAKWLADVHARQQVVRTGRAELTALVRPTCENLRTIGEVKGSISEDRAVALLGGFARIFPRVDGSAIMGVELERNVRLGPWRLKSVLDVVLRDSDGATKVVDFKTGNPEYVDKTQLRMYALSFLARGEASVKLSYAFLRDGTRRSFRMLQHEAKPLALDIARRAREIECDDAFLPRRGRLCGWCGVREHCTAYQPPGILERLRAFIRRRR